MIRSLARKILLVAVVFAITYFINFILIFSGNPDYWGTFTPLVVTIVAFIVGMLILILGTQPPGKKEALT
jgi:hypothetical protein